MSTDWDVICETRGEECHLGQRFTCGPCFGYGTNDKKGRDEAAKFINEHLNDGHKLRIAT